MAEDDARSQDSKSTVNRYRLTLDLGTSVPFEALWNALSDLQTVFEFATAVQRTVNRTFATRSAVRNGGYRPWIDLERFGPWPEVAGMALAASSQSGRWSLSLEREINAIAEELRTSAQIRIEHLRYGSPLTVVVQLSGRAISNILDVIANWGSKRRIEQERLKQETLKTRDYENQVENRILVRNAITRSLLTGQTPIGADEINRLLGVEVIDAVLSLAANGVNISMLDDDGQARDTSGDEGKP